MIKRIIYFGTNSYIHTRKEQLLAEFTETNKPDASVPIEDIGVVILDAPQMTVSRGLLAKLLANNVAVIVCNEKHMPTGLLLNLDGNSVQQEIFRTQINASEPLKKNLWQQTIRHKIENQAGLLDAIEANSKKLKYWREKVKSGDPENVEAHAAAYYWKNIFTGMVDKFKRERFGTAPNSMLNYGYAILRAIVARNLTAAGLLPTLGIHHHNKYNAYALADDIMEPYRPFVDWIVREIIETNDDRDWTADDFMLNTEIKKELLKIPLIDVVIEDKTHPLMLAVQHTCTSLAGCFDKTSRKLIYPAFAFT